MAKKTEITNAIPKTTIHLDPNAVPETPEVGPAVEETVVSVEPAKKVKRRKARTTEELHKLPYNKGWTDAETRAYINYLREEIALKTNMIEELKVSCQRFNEMYQNCDTAYQRLKTAIDNRESFIKQVVGTAYASIMNMKEMQV